MVLMVVGGVLNYTDRATLAVANVAIREDLGLSLSQMGWLLSAFAWSYALAQLPVGAAVDRMGPRRLFGFGLILWSVAQAAGGLVNSFAQFFATRVVLGVGEAPQYPSAAKVVSDWFPPRERGVPTGIFVSSSPLGSALAPLLLTPLMVWTSWRWIFIITGVAGLILAVVWFAMYRGPASLPLDKEERLYVAGGEQPAVTLQPNEAPASWSSLFSHLSTWGMMLGFGGSVYLNWVFLTWLPGYLSAERGMDLMTSGLASSVPFFFGFLGCLIAGWFSDIFSRRSDSALVGRKLPIVLTMLGMAAFTVPAALVESNVVALACISAVIFLANASSACSWALIGAVAPPDRVATLGSLQNFGGFIGGALAPVVTGYIAQSYSFVPALLLGAAAAFGGAMSYLFLVRTPLPRAPQRTPQLAASSGGA